MADDLIRLTLFVPGAAASLTDWSARLARRGLKLKGDQLTGAGLKLPVDVEWVDNPKDGSFGDSFSFGTVSAAVQKTIDLAPGAVVLKWRVELARGRDQILPAIEKLRDGGALAVRIEQSKVGWGIDQWLELLGSGDPWKLHRLAVAMLEAKGSVQSCGMHAFSLPDSRVDDDGPPGAAAQLLGVFNVYQIGEDPLLLSGQTFAPDAETPRRRVERWPDTGYEPGHWCHNPFGVWRFGPKGTKGSGQKELAFTFMPTLSATLLALEKKKGKPLTRAEVEKTRDEGVCMSMSHRDAQKHERERGYADLDPERVWEQWQLISAQHR